MGIVYWISTGFSTRNTVRAQVKPVQTSQEENRGRLPSNVVKANEFSNHNIKTGKLSEAQRKKLLTQAHEEMLTVAKKSGDKEAIQLAEFFKNNAKLAEPISCDGKLGHRVLEKVSNELNFWFVPLDASDQKIEAFHNFFPKDNEDGLAGSYNPDQNGMVYPITQEISPMWRGIYLLHETSHAYHCNSEKYNWRDPKTFCYKELETYEFQFRVASKLFGKDYDVFVKNQADKIFAKLKKENKLGKAWPGPESILPLPIGFKAKSLKEVAVIETSIWLHTLFTLVDSHFHSSDETEIEDQKARILYSLYIKSNVFKE